MDLRTEITSHHKRLDKDEEHRLVAAIKAGAAAREALFFAGAPSALKTASACFKAANARETTLTMDDFIQAAMLGALEAIDKFDPGRGTFATCVYWHARRRCAMLARERMIRVPDTWLNGPKRRQPEDIPTARSSGLSEVLDRATAVYDDHGADDDRPLDRARLDRIKAAMPLLSERQRTVLLLRYVEGCTLLDVGKKLGVSRERVRQIEVQAREMLSLLLGETLPKVKLVKRRSAGE